jgi:hypothetical protein
MYSACAPKPVPVAAKTWSPGRNRVTCLPTASITPARFVPRIGFFGRSSPVAKRMVRGFPRQYVCWERQEARMIWDYAPAITMARLAIAPATAPEETAVATCWVGVTTSPAA